MSSFLFWPLIFLAHSLLNVAVRILGGLKHSSFALISPTTFVHPVLSITATKMFKSAKIQLEECEEDISVSEAIQVIPSFKKMTLKTELLHGIYEYGTTA